MALTNFQTDRAIGAVVASAAGDALGAPYEFTGEKPDSFIPEYGRGALGDAPGSWTDDTAMAVPILEVLATGQKFDRDAAIKSVIDGWFRWKQEDGRGIGIQVSNVMHSVRSDATEKSMLSASEDLHNSAGRSGGNGSLMRIAPLALGYLGEGEEEALVVAVSRLTKLTHWESDNSDACALWSLMIREAILEGSFDPFAALLHIPAERRDRWRELISEAVAPGAHPRDFMQDSLGRNNGWVVLAFQAALSAVAGAENLVDALYRAIRGGHDTDTIAAIAGGLAGAKWGRSALPSNFDVMLHGWIDSNSNIVKSYSRESLVQLASLATLAINEGQSDFKGWPEKTSQIDPTWLHTKPLQHPHDSGVWLGSVSALKELPAEVTAVVSLSLIGSEDMPEGIRNVQVRLIDEAGKNQNLETTLTGAADAIAEFRKAGHQVFLHCAEARSRTSAIAALYAIRHQGQTTADAWEAVSKALPYYDPARFLKEAVNEIASR